MVSDDAAGGGAEQGMVTGDMAGDAAHHRAGDAARVGGRGRSDERSGEREAGEEFHIPHESIPNRAEAAELDFNIWAANLANC
jgi:hypothetical protein